MTTAITATSTIGKLTASSLAQKRPVTTHGSQKYVLKKLIYRARGPGDRSSLGGGLRVVVENRLGIIDMEVMDHVDRGREMKGWEARSNEETLRWGIDGDEEAELSSVEVRTMCWFEVAVFDIGMQSDIL
jgi:hypothetical protein